MKGLIFASIPFLMGAFFLMLYMLFLSKRKKTGNSFTGEREKLIKLKAIEIKSRTEAVLLYLTVFLPLFMSRPVFWGIPPIYAFALCMGLTFAVEILADYYYRRETNPLI